MNFINQLHKNYYVIKSITILMRIYMYKRTLAGNNYSHFPMEITRLTHLKEL